MSKHTPGPWVVLDSTYVFSALGADSGDGCKADSNDGWQVACCATGLTFAGGELTELGIGVMKANARLIAAAPDLLSTLELVKRRLNTCLCDDVKMGEGMMNRLFEDVSEAIARAKGEQA